MYYLRSLLLLLSGLLLAEAALANGDLIPVTRNLDPINHPVLSREEYQTRHSYQETSFRELNRVRTAVGDTDPNRTERNLLIIVDFDLQLQIATALDRYQQDLQLQQLSSILVAFNGTSVENLRSLILEYDDSEALSGVFLIGDLPTAWFELYDDFDDDGVPDEEWASVFPCDLFFSDLDGLWADLDLNGNYDFHGGGMEPDIWIGRIKGDNLSLAPASEADLINSYFERNHLFRQGFLTTSNTALAYVDDDWASGGNEFAAALANGWDEVELIDHINDTNAEDYRSARLPADYDYIQVMVHSGPDAHYFYWNDHQDYELVENWELHGINPTARFYNLFACSNAHFETDNSMGSLYLLDNDHGLIAVGSTKTGSMLYFEDYYTPLGADSTFGAAMQHWWTQNVDVNGVVNMWRRSWFYGMVTLGDPALKTHYPRIRPENLMIFYSEDQVLLEWDDLPGVIAWRVYSSAESNGDFLLDGTGVFTGSSWQAPCSEQQRFYRVTAVLE